MTDGTIYSQSGYMEAALEEARQAAESGEVPVGAVVVDANNGEIICRAGNRTEADNDPTAHAEMLVLRQAGRIKGTPRLTDCDLYVTLEPCPMCAQAISFARVRRVYFGAYDPKGGGVENGPRIFSQQSCFHRPDVYGGIAETDAAALLRSFFADKRRGG